MSEMEKKQTEMLESYNKFFDKFFNEEMKEGYKVELDMFTNMIKGALFMAYIAGFEAGENYES